jgi:hypothetical protein
MTIAQDGVLLLLDEAHSLGQPRLCLELGGIRGLTLLTVGTCSRQLSVSEMRELAKTLTEWAAIVEKRP